MNDEDFKKFLVQLANTFEEDYKNSPIYEHFFKNHQYFEDPSKFSTMVVNPFIRVTQLILKEHFKKPDNVAYLYPDYDFLENNVSKFCEKYSGYGCSVDKGRFIVKSYFKMLETGDVPSFEEDKYKYWCPSFGTEKQWMAFVEGISRLKYGYNEEYLVALNDLKLAHKEKMEKMKGDNDGS
jgi:hypothetical protein